MCLKQFPKNTNARFRMDVFRQWVWCRLAAGLACENSASEMTYTVSGGALNSTHSLACENSASEMTYTVSGGALNSTHSLACEKAHSPNLVRSCRKIKPDGKSDSAILNKFWLVFNIMFTFTLALYGMKCNIHFPPKQMLAESMTMACLHTAKSCPRLDCYQLQ